jgi:fructose-bisphosphate aldolase, class I
MAASSAPTINIKSTLGGAADGLLSHTSKTISKESLYLPGPDFIDRVVSQSDRPIPVLRNFQNLMNHGRLGGTGYVSILPVDQGIEHSAGASFAPNPIYFDPESIVKLAIEGGCNAVASTVGGLASCARKYAHKIPFLVKFNHNEMLTYPNILRSRTSAPSSSATRWGRWRWGPRSTLAAPTRVRRSSTSARCSSRPTAWAW